MFVALLKEGFKVLMNAIAVIALVVMIISLYEMNARDVVISFITLICTYQFTDDWS